MLILTYSGKRKEKNYVRHFIDSIIYQFIHLDNQAVIQTYLGHSKGYRSYLVNNCITCPHWWLDGRGWIDTLNTCNTYNRCNWHYKTHVLTKKSTPQLYVGCLCVTILLISKYARCSVQSNYISVLTGIHYSRHIH